MLYMPLVAALNPYKAYAVVGDITVFYFPFYPGVSAKLYNNELNSS